VALGGEVGWPGGRAWRRDGQIVLAQADDWPDATSNPHRPGALG
jgi:hypothetical protein